MFLGKVKYVLAGNSLSVKYFYAYFIAWFTIEGLAEHFIICKIQQLIEDLVPVHLLYYV